MPELRIKSFCSELTKNKSEGFKSLNNVNMKAESFHSYIRQLYEEHFPEKRIHISNLDKNWMMPQLKQLLRQAQRERIKHGKDGQFKKLWANFRRITRSNIRLFYKKICFFFLNVLFKFQYDQH